MEKTEASGDSDERHTLRLRRGRALDPRAPSTAGLNSQPGAGAEAWDPSLPPSLWEEHSKERAAEL